MERAESGRIYIGLGANLPHPTFGDPKCTLSAALDELGRHGVRIRHVSAWYRSAPVPASDQPWYINAVAEVETDWPADRLLAEMHAVEAALGRTRSVANAARLIDLDLLDFKGEIATGGPGRATLPHPRMAERGFVLRPLADLAPGWRHPTSGQSIRDLVATLPGDQVVDRL